MKLDELSIVRVEEVTRPFHHGVGIAGPGSDQAGKRLGIAVQRESAAARAANQHHLSAFGTHLPLDKSHRMG